MTKLCRTCGTEKPTSEFHKKKNGLQPKCRACVAAYTRLRYAANRERIKAESRLWRAENRERDRAMHRAKYQRTRDQRRKYARRYRRENREAVNAANRAWRRSNPEHTQALSVTRYNRRRARELRAGIGLTAAQWKDIRAEFGGRCAYCAKAAPRLEQDHLDPLVAGGDHAAHNVVPACRWCNASKGPHSLLVWLAHAAAR